jgi:hypothetical protein
MARQSTSIKKGKGRDGSGEGITIRFDCHDKTERRAMQMSKLLASKHGRRKQMIVTFLAAMYDVFEATGELPDAATVAALMTAAATPAQPAMGFTAAVARAHGIQSHAAPGQLTSRQARGQEHVPLVATSAKSATAAEIGTNFLRSVSSLFD